MRIFHYALIATWGIVASYFIACVFTAIFECHPVSYYWDKSTGPGGHANVSCIDETQFYRWNGVANLLIDLLILSLSLPMIWRLNIPLRQKASLTAIFLLGAFVFIASIVRVTSFQEFKPDDLMYTGVAAAIWTDVEQSIGIVCACLPCLRPLLGRVFGLGGRASQGPTGSSSTGNPNGTLTTARSINLAKLNSKNSRLGSLSDPNQDMDGFARLGESPAIGGTTATATANGSFEGDDLRFGCHEILKTQSVKLKYDDLESVVAR